MSDVDVVVVVPWRPDEHPARQRAWDWTRAWYATRFPGWTVLEALCPPGPWIKAAACMPPALERRARVTVVADADVICDGLSAAVTAVLRGQPWAIPHHAVHRLTAQATNQLLAGDDPAGLPVEQDAYRGVTGGGITVLSIDALETVPMDPRFVGWGQEDEAWGVALQTMLGRPWRGLDPLYHLWHPPQPRRTRKMGNPKGEALRRRYALAARRKPEMKALLAEVPCLSPCS